MVETEFQSIKPTVLTILAINKIQINKELFAYNLSCKVRNLVWEADGRILDQSSNLMNSARAPLGADS